MKKVTLAAMAAMVLVTTGATAGTLENATELAVSSMQRVSTTVGTGFADTDNVGGAGIMVNFSSTEDRSGIGWSLSGEASKNYYSATAKTSWLNAAIADVYVGGGYLSADGSTSTNGGCSVAQQMSGTCYPEDTIGTTQNFTEKGGFGILGLSKTFDLTGTKLIADAGYRFGGVEGPVASVGVSKKFGNEFWSKEFGLKIGVEQIKSDVENIDRAAIYGTVSF